METIETLGKYEIRRSLGRGAAGIVYEAWDPAIARRVALKTVRIPAGHDDPETQEQLTRFRREAQAAGRLIHPNIVGVFDYGETDDLAYIVMEFVDGPTVKSLLDNHERFAPAETLRIMGDLLAGLQFSHDRGVVHRDIKPANLMLTADGQAKIADFGIARIESSSMTQAGTVMGTPSYMSPEQFMGQTVDARSDIYSAGVLLYQLLTGDRPFEGSLSAIMHKVLHTEPPAPSQLSVNAPSALDGVVRKAMAKRPDDRFQTAAAFLDALRAAAAGQASLPADAEADATMIAAPLPAAVPVAGARPPRRTNRLPLLAGVATAAVVVGAAAWFGLFRTAPPPPIVASATVSAPTPPATSPSGTAPTVTAPTVIAPTVTAPLAAAPPAVATAPATASASAAAPPAAASSPATAAASQPPVAANPPSLAAPPAVTQAPPLAPAASVPAAPAASPEELRRRLTTLIAGQPCAVVDGEIRDGGTVTLTGLAGLPTADVLRQGLAGIAPGTVNWGIGGVDPVFCPALAALHPILPPFSTGTRLELTLAGGRSRLRDGEHILPRLTLVDAAGSLVVDYVTHDGGVQHLYPQVADPAAGISADPPRSFGAGEAVSLGDPKPGHPAWEAGAPYGVDMIIAIAATRPLFDTSRPANAKSAAVYLRALQAAVVQARQRGDHLAGAALLVETLPKAP